MDLTIQEAYEMSNAVYRGKVIKIDTLFKNISINDLDVKQRVGIEVTIKTSEIFKGNSVDTTKVISLIGGPSCGVHFILNQEFLVYTKESNSLGEYKSPKKFLYTNSCSGTKYFSTYCDNEIVELRKLSK